MLMKKSDGKVASQWMKMGVGLKMDWFFAAQI